MTIADLLMSQHRWGRTRCRRFLAAIPMSETKTIGSMTDRQRHALAARLGGETADARARPVRAGRPRCGRAELGSGAGDRRPLSGRVAGAEAGAARGDLDDVTVGVADVDRAEATRGRRRRCTRTPCSRR